MSVHDQLVLSDRKKQGIVETQEPQADDDIYKKCIDAEN